MSNKTEKIPVAHICQPLERELKNLIDAVEHLPVWTESLKTSPSGRDVINAIAQARVALKKE